MYSVMTCLQCHCLYKSCMPGYVGRGRRGELQGIYSEHSYPGFCSQFCQLRRVFSRRGRPTDRLLKTFYLCFVKMDVLKFIKAAMGLLQAVSWSLCVLLPFERS
ncbi:hypothetical protein SKAU_G00429600 [Synaphobranchus kaupii]|uniref:CxC7-like cysteine cluster associated with KDZ transposases domain-containing protein n=1 Tax=Synaphobranchus kaupii TaxID=118154 RepID=A0A9Q1E4E7_SYNKA|nr:hypothetical protein SKAU_G00429600 [Synaphobranchus kaupii]